jgi:NAD(P)-dependent dehydrogenase (short-subunit alcohol dehydrogenase family)
MASKLIAVVAGVGPGTGAAIAKKFALKYPVVLLARNPENYESLVQEINSSGGKAIGVSTDVSDSTSVQNAFKKVKAEFGDNVGAAVSDRISFISLIGSYNCINCFTWKLPKCYTIQKSIKLIPCLGSNFQCQRQICQEALP